jgi:hypothetical protein
MQRFDALSRQLERLTFGALTVSLLALFPLVVIIRMKIVEKETAVHAWYWSIAFATTFGAGPDPANNMEYALSVIWMVLSITMWSAVFADITQRLAAFVKDR